MKILLTLFTAIIMCVSALAQNAKKENESIIRALRLASNEAIKKKDVAGIASYWLPDIIQIRGNGTYQIGKDSIVLLWRKTFNDNPEVSFIRNPSEVIISKAGTLAWESGTWIGINSYSKGGKYSAMWRKRNGVWKMQAELFVALE